MNAEELYEMLKKSQEPKGYYFNKDRQRVMDLRVLEEFFSAT